jgi:mRNA-degrading endonuclease RelE of RelBE toxin-antitoxin system
MLRMKIMEFEELPEFGRDLKKLLKKYRTLEEDLETIKKVLAVQPENRLPLSFRMTGYIEKYFLVKMKKIACKALKGRGSNSGIRIIYEYKKEMKKIVFVEIYFKGENEIEDKERLKKYYGQ